MSRDLLNNANDFTSMLIKTYVKEHHICLDGTVGNGNDTMKILNALNGTGKIYGFDIQEDAINHTESLIFDRNYNTEVLLIKDSHEYVDRYIKERINFAIYNLGYLPGGDKHIKTDHTSTIISIRKVLDLLAPNGILLITVYLGHPGGMDEYKAINDYLETLEQKNYNVFKLKFINQKNNPPITFGVEARGGE